MPKCYIHIIHVVLQAQSQVMPKLLPDTLPPCNKHLLNVYCLQYIYSINNTFICMHYIIIVYKQATSPNVSLTTVHLTKSHIKPSSFGSDPCIRNMETHRYTLPKTTRIHEHGTQNIMVSRGQKPFLKGHLKEFSFVRGCICCDL